MPDQTGLLVVISSPSGGGKDTVIRALLQIFPDSTRFVTTTSRPPRPGQTDGVDYHFVSREQFEQKIKNNELIEYNEYSGNLYGTEKKYLEADLKKYQLVLTQIEINGKHNFDRAHIPHLSIFILPDNLDNLRARILRRGGITPDIADARIKIAQKEMAAASDYDFQVINTEGELAKTIEKVAEIIQNHLPRK